MFSQAYCFSAAAIASAISIVVALPPKSGTVTPLALRFLLLLFLLRRLL
jgi:hypothetical protein